MDASVLRFFYADLLLQGVFHVKDLLVQFSFCIMVLKKNYEMIEECPFTRPGK